MDEDSRVLFLLALGLALAILAGLALHRADARRARGAEARERSLQQARDQQAATAEILSAIAASPPDLQRVLDTIVRNAARVCDGLYAVAFRFDGTQIRLAAHHRLSPARLEAINRRYPRGLGDEGPMERAIRGASVVHYPDIPTDPSAPAWIRELSLTEGFRSLVIVPMLRDGRVLGTLNVSRPESGFTERQIQLLRSFADQAVIAIENVRLFQELQARNRELTEALEQQTATAGILHVISSSPTDLQPVLDAVAESAARVCGATDSHICLLEGDVLRVVAIHGEHRPSVAVRDTISATPATVSGRAVCERRTIHIDDFEALPETEYAETRARIRLGHSRNRTTLVAPLLREGKPLGSIVIRRDVFQPFSAKQIALLETFAAQAVIAIENVRLFRELQARNRELTEALEQQTATAEILRVISSSPTDLAPVMDAVTQNATRLAQADHALIGEAVEGRILWLAASGCLLASEGPPISRQLPSGRAILDCQTTQVEDVTELVVDFPGVRRAYDEFGVRTILATPLVREGLAIGVLLVRRTTVRPFTGKEIDLLRTFADQAGIAIENVRLFQELQARNRELSRALEREQATGEVLRVIGSSPASVEPVFDAILTSAMRLCDTPVGVLFLYDGDAFRLVADRGAAPAFVEPRRIGFRVGPHTGLGRAVRERRPVQIPDITADVAYAERDPARMSTVELLGARTGVWVPMLREGAPVGVICTWRREVRAFTDSQIDLLATFAAQAVIAMENARLFQELEARNRDLTEALEQQTATAEILRAISSSPTDVQPVFATIARNAVRLCDGVYCAVFQVDGDRIDLVAHHNMPPEAVEELRRRYPAPLSVNTGSARAARERVVVHISDVESDLTVTEARRQLARMVGYRSQAWVPMLRGDRTLGVINVNRREAEPFPDQHIALLRTFADQAVIAIENVRLFQELQARNRDLTESLEQQTATAEILRVISSSPADLQPVMDAVAESAARFCGADNVVVYRLEGEVLRAMAVCGPMPTVEVPLSRGLPTGRAMLDRETVHVPDLAVAEDEYPEAMSLARRTGNRALLAAPLLAKGEAIGAIVIRRQTPGLFTDKQVNLLQTFADQAVIAIENVRLFQELQARNRELMESLEQQTATAEILRVISSSPTDERPVFDAIAANAARVCEAGNANVYRFDGSLIHLAASHGYPAEELAAVKGIFPIPPGRGSATARAVSTGAIAHIPDMSTDTDLAYPALVQAGFQTSLSVPMLRDGRPIGAITVARREVRPFSDRQVALLQTFAAQAVIAVENVRLFTELGMRNRELTESLEQQTATSEILRAISSSPTDAQPVFDTIAQHAVRICDARHCLVFRFDGALIHMVAHHHLLPEALREFQRAYPLPLDADTLSARSIRDRTVVHCPDLLNDPGTSELVRRMALAGGYRSGIIVPMLRSGDPIGAIGVLRSAVDGEPRPFSDKEIALLQTFADQAVIAVENVRLFQELQAQTRALARSVEELQALSEVGRAVSSTLDLPTVLATIVARAVQLSGTSGGVIYEYEEATQEFYVRASHRTEDDLVEVLRSTPIRLGQGVSGQAALRRAPVEVADLLEDPQYHVARVQPMLTRLGYRSVLGIPLLLERRILGALTVWRREPGSFPPETVNLLQTFATQSVLAIQNARLFREIEAKSRELEVASQHKSQFLANMSHELRTPLNAILGYTELLVDGIYGDLPPKIGDVMTRIDRSGKHLLGLINDVLDLSKIEAGQLELALTEYSLNEVVHAVVTQVESLAAEKGLSLAVTVAPDLPAGRGDDRRLAQVLLNLVGNAIKFTEAGEVRVAARVDGDVFVVSVRDTGPGIAEVDRQRIFQEFQQADSSSTRKKGGTGLGLSIARRIVELHGGRIWVESTVGRGSTFSFRVPVRVERQVARG